MNCLLCGELLSERGFFCKACAGQVRCMKCRELLEPSAIACVECGTRVGQPSAEGNSQAARPSTDGALPAHRNTLSYQEDRNSRRFEASLTDDAMQGLGEVLGDFFVQRGVARQSGQGRFQREVSIEAHKELPPPQNDGGAAPVAMAAETPSAPTPPVEESSDKARLMKLFSSHGTTLELMDNRLKAKKGAEFLRRLTYLFLYAHESHGRMSTPEHEVIKALQTAKIWDGSGNGRRWLTKKVGLAAEGDDGLKLTIKGREEAVKALNEALDPNIPDGWNPDTKVTKARRPRKKKA